MPTCSWALKNTQPLSLFLSLCRSAFSFCVCVFLLVTGQGKGLRVLQARGTCSTAYFLPVTFSIYCGFIPLGVIGEIKSQKRFFGFVEHAAPLSPPLSLSFRQAGLLCVIVGQEQGKGSACPTSPRDLLLLLTLACHNPFYMRFESHGCDR